MHAPLSATLKSLSALQASWLAALLLSTPGLALSTTLLTEAGRLEGAWADTARSILVFRGIRYAKPPVGVRRFAPPVAEAAWQGTRSALRFGPACPQHPAVDAFVWSRGKFEASEDCLNLNIWTPSAQRGPLRAVMVWFHGGAHITGYAHAELFDGTALAAAGVVVVTVNYRLGSLGFLAHPALRAASEQDSSGNYGLMDQVAALRWVRNNIEAFGGDPERVTIFGQSAGSQSVCALMTAPSAQGLFQRAIGQSASCVLPPRKGPAHNEPTHRRTDPTGELRGIALIKQALGSRPPTAAALRNMPVERLLAAELATGWADKSRLVVDGWVLPEHPSAVFTRGAQTAVPLLVGSTADEGVGLLPLIDDLTEPALVAAFAQRFTTPPDQLLTLYRAHLERSPGHALREVLSDQMFALGMRTWAAHQHRIGQPTYLYFMAHVPPAFRLYDAQNPALPLADGPRSAGAYHSGDLAFVFGNTRNLGLHWQAEDHALSNAMLSYWVQFAKTGDPNRGPLPRWPAFDPIAQKTLVLDTPLRIENGVRRAKLDAISR